MSTGTEMVINKAFTDMTVSDVTQALTTVKNMIAKDATDQELQLLAMRCKATGLDPFSNQIYLIVRGSGDNRKATFQTGIDGYRSVAEGSGSYAGNDDYEYDEAFATGKSKTPVWARSTVYRIVDGQRVTFSATARWAEYAQVYNGKVSNMWAKFPSIMLGKCAEALALRKAFPKQLSGIYTTEEMAQSEIEAKEPKEIKEIKPVKIVKEVVAKPEPTQEEIETCAGEWITKVNDCEELQELSTVHGEMREAKIPKQAGLLIKPVFEKRKFELSEKELKS